MGLSRDSLGYIYNSRLHDRGLVGLNIAYMVSGLGWIVEIRVLSDQGVSFEVA